MAADDHDETQSGLEIGQEAFTALADHLQAATGIVLSEAKKGLAVSRLSRRLRALNLPDFDAYCALLTGPDGATELEEMILLLTTNVTRFFREMHHFEALKNDILPGLLDRARKGGRVRIWSAGCSSGEEAYSIAMSVFAAGSDAGRLDIRILATDIDRNMIAKGRLGCYRLDADDIARQPSLGKDLLPKAGSAHEYEVSDRLREMVQFGELNLTKQWPMQGKFDVIFCRNVVIYFSPETQRRLWPRFAAALQPGGQLMIGHSERVTGPAIKVLRSNGVTQYQHHPK
ncbi:protein-glutamate O-methyltransferase [Gymnodinialimonas sp. 2305UL16-5]|uniref:CheR family methyltransferase n=1 Tax=Gymnodinialimonas mytili TaxID=3126503 RepID=UPI0030B6D681